jgi:hypothetical protein
MACSIANLYNMGTFTQQRCQMNLRLKVLAGEDFNLYEDELAKLRLSIFCEYPYLYDGNLSYDKDYVNRYDKNKDSTIILILDDTNLVGVSTSTPLKNEILKIQQPFIDDGYNIEEIYYLVESILLSPYRGQGIYHQLFTERELVAKNALFKYTAFCAIERSDSDPRKPKNYKDLKEIWARYGYKEHPELVTNIDWKEIGVDEMKSHKLVFWVKKL